MPHPHQLVYLMLNVRSGYIKIGISNRPKARESTLQAEEPEIVLIATAEGGRDLEGRLHRMFADSRLRGEWFALTKEDVGLIIKNYGFTRLQTENPLISALCLGQSYEDFVMKSFEASRHFDRFNEGAFELCLGDEDFPDA